MVYSDGDVDATVNGHSIQSASGGKTYVYSLSDIAPDGQLNNVPDGVHIVKQGSQTRKVTVKP